MLDFLLELGISNNVLIDIRKNNSEASIYNFSCNKDDVIKIIQFLNGLGINCITQLLIYRLDRFLVSFDSFKKILSDKDMSELIDLLNDDYTAIDEL